MELVAICLSVSQDWVEWGRLVFESMVLTDSKRLFFFPFSFFSNAAIFLHDRIRPLARPNLSHLWDSYCDSRSCSWDIEGREESCFGQRLVVFDRE